MQVLVLQEVVERQIEFEKVGELEGKQCLIPAGKLRKLVVGETQSALLRLIEVLDAHHRHGRTSELPGSGQPPMAGDDLASLVHEKRADKVEGSDGLSDLRDLPLGMAPGIPVIAGKAGRRDVLDGERDLAGVLGRVASSLIERLTTGGVRAASWSMGSSRMVVMAALPGSVEPDEVGARLRALAAWPPEVGR